jgi:histidine kinase
VDRASNIINHMREFGRKADMVLQPVMLNTVILKALAIFQQQLKLKNILTALVFEENLPIIMGDPGLLEQVFVNLFINARDAIEDFFSSGHTGTREKRIQVITRSENGFVLVQFSDSGAGIAQGITQRIFEPFFTTKKVGEGTGLGLSISYGIVKGCGGTIRLVSNAPAGASFLLKFPVAKERPDEA